MKFFNVFSIVLSILFFILVLPQVEAETIRQTMEGSLDLEINHPNNIIAGRTFSISILLTNNGWEDKQDINLVLTNPDGSIVAVDNNGRRQRGRLSAGGDRLQKRDEPSHCPLTGGRTGSGGGSIEAPVSDA